MAESNRQVKQDGANSRESKPKPAQSKLSGAAGSSPSLDAIRQDVLSSVTSQTKAGSGSGSHSVSSLGAIPEVEANEVTDGELRHKQKQQKHEHKKAMMEKKYGESFNPDRVEVAVPVFPKKAPTFSMTSEVIEQQREIESLRKSVRRSINMADALQALGALEPKLPPTSRVGPVPIEPISTATQWDESISAKNEKSAADRKNGPTKISSPGPVPIESPALSKKNKPGKGDLTTRSETKEEVQKTGPRPILTKDESVGDNDELQQDRPVRSFAKEKRRDDAGKKKGLKENNDPSPVLDIREQKRLFQERIQQQKEQQQQEQQVRQQQQQERQQKYEQNRQQYELKNNQERQNNRGQYNNGPRQPMRTFLQEHQAEVAKKTKENKGPGTVVKEVLIPSDGLTVKEVSQRFSMRVNEVISKLVELGELDAGSLKKGKGKVRSSRLKRKKASAGVTSQEEVHIDADVMELLALEFGLNSRRVNSKIQDMADNSDHDFLTAARREVAEEGLVRRPAMVTIMGHVDHGKTTLLDSLRRLDMTTANTATSSSSSSGAKNKSSKQPEQTPTVESIAEQEAGGITQKLSAFSVTLPPREVVEGEEDGTSEERRIVMVDTPGHAAFTSMRSMGATSTDIVILLISMESGIQPQTAECLTLVQKNQLPVVIAVNKVDKYSAAERTAALNKINNTLASRFNILTTDYGGYVPIVPISAKTGYNLPLLVEAVQSLCNGDVLKQHDNTNTVDEREEGEEDVSGLNSLRQLQKRLYVLEEGEAEGIVLDSYLEKGRGVVTNLITSWGRLAVGDNIIIGTTYGKVRALYNESNKPIPYATPGTIVKVIGLKELPPIGEELITVESESDAKTISDRRKRLNELKEARRQAAVSSAVRSGTTAAAAASSRSQPDATPAEEKVVKVVLKADSVGSLEALKFIVSSITEAAKEHHIDVRVIHQQVGDVLVSDVELAGTASTTGEGHLILAFNVGPKDQQTRQLSKQLDVDIQSNDIIYRLEEELIRKIEDYLPKEEHIEREGVAKVQKVFKVKDGTIAGLDVTSGKLVANAKNLPGSTATTSSGDLISYFYKVIRNDEVILEQSTGVVELKRFKDRVKQVDAGNDCGLHILNFEAFEEGDIIECYKVSYEPKKLQVGYQSHGNQHGYSSSR
eukprot:scaffold14707_cov176-Ochromonas_danica.AAC.4